MLQFMVCSRNLTTDILCILEFKSKLRYKVRMTATIQQIGNLADYSVLVL